MKTNLELCKTAFHAINSFKRSRALAEQARYEGNTEAAIYHELKQFKEIDRLELTLRAIQSNLRKVYDNDSDYIEGHEDEDEDERELRIV